MIRFVTKPISIVEKFAPYKKNKKKKNKKLKIKIKKMIKKEEKH